MYTALFWKDDTYMDMSSVSDSSALGDLSNYATAIQALPEWGDGTLVAQVFAYDPSWDSSGGGNLALASGPTGGFGSVGVPPVNLQSLLFPS